MRRIYCKSCLQYNLHKLLFDGQGRLKPNSYLCTYLKVWRVYPPWLSCLTLWLIYVWPVHTTMTTLRQLCMFTPVIMINPPRTAGACPIHPTWQYQSEIMHIHPWSTPLVTTTLSYTTHMTVSKWNYAYSPVIYPSGYHEFVLFTPHDNIRL